MLCCCLLCRYDLHQKQCPDSSQRCEEYWSSGGLVVCPSEETVGNWESVQWKWWTSEEETCGRLHGPRPSSILETSNCCSRCVRRERGSREDPTSGGGCHRWGQVARDCVDCYFKSWLETWSHVSSSCPLVHVPPLMRDVVVSDVVSDVCIAILSLQTPHSLSTTCVSSPLQSRTGMVWGTITMD